MIRCIFILYKLWKYPAHILEVFFNDSIAYTISRLISYDLTIQGAFLNYLSNDSYFEIRSAVAAHPNTTLHILEKLSDDGHLWVRAGVANNPNTPDYILEKLSNDKHLLVRKAVANNPNIPIHLLEKLSNDSDTEIRLSVAKNPNTPPELKTFMLLKY